MRVVKVMGESDWLWPELAYKLIILKRISYLPFRAEVLSAGRMCPGESGSSLMSETATEVDRKGLMQGRGGKEKHL